MVTIYNSDLTKELADVAKIQVSREYVPNQIADKVVPVIDVNPKHARRVNIMRSSNVNGNSAATVYTTPADKDFYLTSVTFSFTKDALCDLATTRLGVNVIVDGSTQSPITMGALTLTAQDKVTSTNFDPPIRVDRNTTISLPSITTTAGTVTRAIAITGYTVDNINA